MNRGKLNDSSKQMILLGYDDNNSSIYKCYDTQTNKIVYSRDVTFIDRKDADIHHTELSLNTHITIKLQIKSTAIVNQIKNHLVTLRVTVTNQLKEKAPNPLLLRLYRVDPAEGTRVYHQIATDMMMFHQNTWIGTLTRTKTTIK